MPEMLRLAIVTSYFYPHIGGIATQLSALAPRLHAAGAEVHVLAPEAQAEPYAGSGVTVHPLRIRGQRLASSSAFVTQSVALLARLRPHVIHAHELLLPTTASVLAKPLAGARLVVSVHSAGPDLGEIARLQRARWGQRRLAYLRTQVDRFVGVSHAILQEMADAGIPEARRVLIPNGVDLNRFQPLEGDGKQALRSRLGLPAGALAIYTGRLSTEKRVESLVRVWPQILKVRQDAQLVIVGDGPEEEKLKQLAGPGIHFIGATREVSAYLQAADLLVLPSASEGFSLSVLEGMACGLPVVATRVGGVPDLVVDGITGLLTPVDDQAALIAGMSALLADPVRCTEMGASARRRAISVFSLDSVALRLYDLYQQVVHHAPATAPVA